MAEPIEQIEKGWPAIRRAPFHFLGALMVLVFLGWMAIYLHYSATIQGKDATIQAKDSVIQSKETTIDAQQKSVQAMQQTVATKDELIMSLTNQFHRIMVFQEE